MSMGGVVPVDDGRTVEDFAAELRFFMSRYAAMRTRLRLAADERVELTVGDVSYRVPCLAAPDLPRGVAEFPTGLPGLTGLVLPAWGTIRRVSGT